jgi:hypothetical protein
MVMALPKLALLGQALTMTSPQELAAQMADKADQELQEMFARPADWSAQALDAGRMELTKRNIDVETVAAMPKSQGLSCPKCSQTDIRRPFRWRDFQISILLAFIASTAFEVITARLSSNSLLLKLPLVSVLTCCLVLPCWTFFSALLDMKRCRTCSHRWKGKV